MVCLLPDCKQARRIWVIIYIQEEINVCEQLKEIIIHVVINRIEPTYIKSEPKIIEQIYFVGCLVDRTM